MNLNRALCEHRRSEIGLKALGLQLVPAGTGIGRILLPDPWIHIRNRPIPTVWVDA